MFPSDQCSLAQWLLLRTDCSQQPGHGSPNRNEGLLVERRNMLSIFIPCKPSFSFFNDIKRNCYLLDFCGHKNVGLGNSQFGILMKSHFWSYICTWWLWTLLPARVSRAVTAHQTLKWSPPSSVCIHHLLQLCFTWFQGFLICINVRPRPLLFGPRKWEMHELYSDFLSLQVLLTNTGPLLAELI